MPSRWRAGPFCKPLFPGSESTARGLPYGSGHGSQVSTLALRPYVAPTGRWPTCFPAFQLRRPCRKDLAEICRSWPTNGSHMHRQPVTRLVQQSPQRPPTTRGSQAPARHLSRGFLTRAGSTMTSRWVATPLYAGFRSGSWRSAFLTGPSRLSLTTIAGTVPRNSKALRRYPVQFLSRCVHVASAWVELERLGTAMKNRALRCRCVSAPRTGTVRPL